jgi:hypothetical protein
MESINKKYVNIKIQIPTPHYNVAEKVAKLLECKTDLIFQRSLNHALKSGTLGHVLESMLNEKYKTIFNNPRNTHDLTL